MPDRSKSRMRWISEPSREAALRAPANIAKSVDMPGSIRVRDLVIAPSGLSSNEFRNFCTQGDLADSLAMMAARMPSRTDPRVAWDEFDAWVDSYYYAQPLSAARQTYSVETFETEIAGVRVSVVLPKDGVAATNEGRVLINLHGGGFLISRGLVTGQLESIPVAAIGRMKVITLDYRQAPFFRYPAASEDVEAVYIELMKQYRPEAIGIFGCSSGGILASQSIARFQSKGLPLPGAVGIFNMAPPPPYGQAPPWDSRWGDSGLWFPGVPRNVPTEAERVLWDAVFWYMEGAELDDTNAYPGSSDAVLARFPSTLFMTGTRDFAASTVMHAHARLLRLGVDSSLYLMEGAPHGAHVTAVGTREAHDAHAYVVRWFERHLSQ